VTQAVGLAHDERVQRQAHDQRLGLRLRHLRRALGHLARARDAGDAWFCTPGQICAHMDGLAAARPGAFA
ncbi:hypothetical protein, partial [Priestia megaterium]|uniref:hypothetical protein n=1 Tax=Priestia megaterium TaxID=1404 RepID=UPI0035B5AF49